MLEEIIEAFRQVIKTFRQTRRQTVRAFGQNVRALEKPLLSVSCVKDKKLSLVDVYPEKKVTYISWGPGWRPGVKI